MLNQTVGVFVYGVSGRAQLPFFGGTLCVRPPLVRTPPQLSGGNPLPHDCSGSLAIDFNAWIQGLNDPTWRPG